MINVFKILAMCFFLQGLWSCKKDEIKQNTDFNLDQIYQTGWKGSLIIYKEGETTVHNISLLFSEKNFGSFEIRSAGDGNFQYRIEGKSLQIFSTGSSDAPTYLYGDYMLLDGANKDEINLKSHIYSESYYQVLKLQRIY